MTPGPFAHTDGHDTEHAAAASVRLSSKTIATKVLSLLVEAGELGLTDDEGAQLLTARYGFAGDRLTFGRRRHELRVAGRVAKTGLRRRTPSGRQAIVWAAT